LWQLTSIVRLHTVVAICNTCLGQNKQSAALCRRAS